MNNISTLRPINWRYDLNDATIYLNSMRENKMEKIPGYNEKPKANSAGEALTSLYEQGTAFISSLKNNSLFGNDSERKEDDEDNMMFSSLSGMINQILEMLNRFLSLVSLNIQDLQNRIEPGKPNANNAPGSQQEVAVSPQYSAPAQQYYSYNPPHYPAPNYTAPNYHTQVQNIPVTPMPRQDANNTFNNTRANYTQSSYNSSAPETRAPGRPAVAAPVRPASAPVATSSSTSAVSITRSSASAPSVNQNTKAAPAAQPRDPLSSYGSQFAQDIVPISTRKMAEFAHSNQKIDKSPAAKARVTAGINKEGRYIDGGNLRVCGRADSESELDSRLKHAHSMTKSSFSTAVPADNHPKFADFNATSAEKMQAVRDYYQQAINNAALEGYDNASEAWLHDRRPQSVEKDQIISMRTNEAVYKASSNILNQGLDPSSTDYVKPIEKMWDSALYDINDKCFEIPKIIERNNFLKVQNEIMDKRINKMLQQVEVKNVKTEVKAHEVAAKPAQEPAVKNTVSREAIVKAPEKASAPESTVTNANAQGVSSTQQAASSNDATEVNPVSVNGKSAAAGSKEPASAPKSPMTPMSGTPTIANAKSSVVTSAHDSGNMPDTSPSTSSSPGPEATHAAKV